MNNRLRDQDLIWASSFLLIALTIFLVTACDSDPSGPTPIAAPTPQVTDTPPISIGGPANPPAVGTEVAAAIPTGKAAPGEADQVLSGFPADVTSLAWSPDGTLLATSMGGFGGLERGPGTHDIWLWSADGKLMGKWAGHTGGVQALAWSPEGEVLASGSTDGTVRLWGKDGSPHQVMHTDAGAVFSLSWSPHGERLAVGALKSTDDNTAQIWTRIGALEKTLHTKHSGGKFYNVAWSPDGKYLVGGAIDYALWDAVGTVITTTSACKGCTPAWGLAWSPDSKLWAIGDESGYVGLYDTSGEQVRAIQALSGVTVMAWSPDGTLIAMSNGLWKPGGTRVGSLRGFRSTVTSLSWSPDGKLLAAGASGIGNSGLVGVFAPDGSEIYRAENEDGQVNRVAWSPDGKLLAAAYENGTVRLLHVENGVVR